MKRYIQDPRKSVALTSHAEYYGRTIDDYTAAHSLLSLQTFKFHYPPGITYHGLKNDLTEHATGQLGAENDAKTGHL